MAKTKFKKGYASVNGLEMYYEIHGTGQPLVLLHGAFSAIGTSFGKLLPDLAKTRQVIAFELQAHGHTADIDRPLSPEAMADDVAAAIRQLGLGQADIFGYSMGAFVALHLVIRHPELVHKLVLASISYTFPEHFAMFFAKKTEMDRQTRDLSAEDIRGIKSPTLIIIGDSDLIRPEHAVEMFRLLGGGVFGDTPAGLPNSQLAILPGTSHVSIVNRAELLLPMITSFLDAPMPQSRT
jgi:pimeloyl-ACP methyl ester carboxylesterase